MLWIYLIALAFIGYVFFYVVKERIRVRKVRTLIAGRAALSTEQFWDLFEQIGIPRDVVARVAHIVEQELLIDLARIRPDDSLMMLCAVGHIDSLAIVELIMNIEELFAIEFSDREAEEIQTLLDLMRIVSQKLERTTHTTHK